ncbi:Thiamine-binding periplasmic protein precursor [Serratia ficaria]|nr:Thiamine-binding periplasmic protein precursor [Serratia ficaria]
MVKKYLPCLLLLCAAPVLAKPTLTVYTYDSFAADWGPGPAVKKAFEAECGCALKSPHVRIVVASNLKISGGRRRQK